MALNLNMKKVSFDFDSTLDREDVQEFARTLSLTGYEVWITTTRQNTENALARGHHWVERQNEQLYEVAASCWIKKDHIKFTEFVDKIEFINGKNFLFHLDDDVEELVLISESNDDCVPVDVNLPGWKEKCLEILKISDESI